MSLIYLYHLAQSTIIPLPKPGKGVNDSNSYRPISLVCPASIILEKCIIPILQQHLKCAPHQVPHGFRSRHSTVTAINELATAIANGFNQRQPADRTLLVALDLSKAFDTVSHNSANATEQLKPARSTGLLAEHIHA